MGTRTGLASIEAAGSAQVRGRRPDEKHTETSMPLPIRVIVAGVGTFDGTDPVLVPALDLARRLGATLHVVHAVDPRAAVHPANGVPQRLAGRTGELPVGVDLMVHVRRGPAGEQVSELAREVEADLVLVGATHRSRVRRYFLGTTAEAVARDTPAPLLVVRGAEAWPCRRVLLATDLSAAGACQLERGLDVVETLAGGAPLQLRSLAVVSARDSLPQEVSRTVLEVTAQSALDRFLRERRPRSRAVEGKVRVGSVAGEILDETADWRADLVVVGRGGVSGRVLRDSSCSVLVVPERQGARHAPAAVLQAAALTV